MIRAEETLSGTVSTGDISGSLSVFGSVDGSVEGEGLVSGVVNPGAEGIDGEVSGVGVVSGTLILPDKAEHEIYDGEYEVTPKVREEVVLDTFGKLMKDDVTVKEVPNYQTSNDAGGITFYIGVKP